MVLTGYNSCISDNDTTITIDIQLRLLKDAAVLLSKLFERVQMLGLERSQVSDLLIKWDFSLQVDLDEVCEHSRQLDYEFLVSALFFVQEENVFRAGSVQLSLHPAFLRHASGERQGTCIDPAYIICVFTRCDSMCEFLKYLKFADLLFVHII